MKNDYKNRVTNPDELPLVLTVSDIANVLGISRNTAYQHIHEKGFPAFVVGGKEQRNGKKKLYRISKAKFLEWLEHSA